jgi:hypothetical protein
MSKDCDIVCEKKVGSPGYHCGTSVMIQALRTIEQRAVFCGFDFDLPLYLFVEYRYIVFAEFKTPEKEVKKRDKAGFICKDFLCYFVFLKHIGLVKEYVWKDLRDFQLNKIFCNDKGPDEGMYFFFGHSIKSDKKKYAGEFIEGKNKKVGEKRLIDELGRELNDQEKCHRYYTWYVDHPYEYGHAAIISVEPDRKTFWLYDTGRPKRVIATIEEVTKSIVGHHLVYKFDLIL